jgi:hypothetical protein
MRGPAGQLLHTAVGLAQRLAKDDTLAIFVLLGTELSNRDLCLGLHVGRASVEEGQRSGGEWTGADSISRLYFFTDRCWPPGVVAGRHNLHYTVHLGEGSHLDDGPAKPRREKHAGPCAADTDDDQGQHCHTR